MNKRRRSHVLLSGLLIALVSALSACGGKGSPGVDSPTAATFKCGSQGFSEPEIHCEMVKALIEAKTPHKVEHVTGLGSQMAGLKAVEADDLQFIIGYTGTLLLGLYEKQVTRDLYDPDKAWQFVHDQMLKDHAMWVFKPWGFNNTYALVMRRDRAEELGIKKTSDLAQYADKLKIATDPTWQNYPGQGYTEWQALYGFKFSKAPEMDYGLLYRAVDSKDVDAAMAYSTDGRIKSLNLVVIDDDKQFNPPYHGVLLMTNTVKEKYPDVYQLLTQLEGKITTEEMIALNAQADVDGKEPDAVAREWLKAKALLQ